VKNLLLLLLNLFLFVLNTGTAFAIENPLTLANNKIGVHILFTSEINLASNLINSSLGDWGYVTIPIQAGDKDLEKWQKFMNDAEKLHVIPIIRLATEGDYFNTSVWRKPTREDILDFANFLNSLKWPVKNKYVVVFNEVNRSDEWEGSPQPAEYANILKFAVSAFKSLSEDFFIISAGLDNGATDIAGKSMDQYNFMLQMDNAVPGIFGQIDGLGSHSYPNPAFSAAPWVVTRKSISSFKFERNLAYELSGKKLPVFITETGWSSEKVSENQISRYFIYAFEKVWSDQNIVGVTPFLLQAGPGPFFQFTLLNENGEHNVVSRALQKIPKTKGNPTINIQLSSSSFKSANNIPFKTFQEQTQYETSPALRAKTITPFLKWILRLEF